MNKSTLNLVEIIRSVIAGLWVETESSQYFRKTIRVRSLRRFLDVGCSQQPETSSISRCTRIYQPDGSPSSTCVEYIFPILRLWRWVKSSIHTIGSLTGFYRTKLLFAVSILINALSSIRWGMQVSLDEGGWMKKDFPQGFMMSIYGGPSEREKRQASLKLSHSGRILLAGMRCLVAFPIHFLISVRSASEARRNGTSTRKTEGIMLGVECQ